MNRNFTNTVAIVIALTSTLLLAACCGGESSTGAATGVGDEPETSTVTIVDNSYEPSAPVVSSGDIELINEGESPHTFTIDGQDVDVEVEAGKTATATVDLPAGTYTLFCRFHRSQGMETTLTVR